MYSYLSDECPEDPVSGHLIEYNAMQEDPVSCSKPDTCLCRLFLVTCMKLCGVSADQASLSPSLEQVFSTVCKFRAALSSAQTCDELPSLQELFSSWGDSEEESVVEDPIMKLVKGSSVHLVKQYLIRTPKSQKIVNLLSFLEGKRSLIFVKSYREASRILTAVQECHMVTAPLAGVTTWTHAECLELLNLFNTGRSSFVIMTLSDFIGNDFSNVEQVIIYNLPLSINHYVFQIAGHKEAIAFYDPVADVGLASSLVKLLEYANKHVPVWLLEEQSLLPSTSTAPPPAKVAVESAAPDVRTTAFLNLMFVLCQVRRPEDVPQEKLLEETLHFVLNKPLKTDPEDSSTSGWKTDIADVQKSLEMQQERGLARVKSLKQMYNILLPSSCNDTVSQAELTAEVDNKQPDTSDDIRFTLPLLSFAYEQVLCGYFGVSPEESTAVCSYLGRSSSCLDHYLNNIPCVPLAVKRQVTHLMHCIYSRLICMLRDSNAMLRAVTVLCISQPMLPPDLSHVVQAGESLRKYSSFIL